jgi:Domain of unknown function (DUF892)
VYVQLLRISRRVARVEDVSSMEKMYDHPAVRDLYLEELKDLYAAENRLTKALPKMAEAAESPKPRTGFEEHLEQTKQHALRLEQIFALALRRRRVVPPRSGHIRKLPFHSAPRFEQRKSKQRPSHRPRNLPPSHRPMREEPERKKCAAMSEAINQQAKDATRAGQARGARAGRG